MKNRIFLLLLVVPQLILGQNKAKQFDEILVDSQNVQYISDLRSYVSFGSNNIYRNSVLDSVANVRADYFLDVLEETAKKFCLYDLTSAIPKNSTGHTRYFGTPGIFKEPTGCKFPERLPELPKYDLKVRAEVMQQISWRKRSQYEYPTSKLVEMATSAMVKNFGKSYILDGYKLSTAHRNAIKENASGDFGVCTKALISKEWDSLEKEWVYEVVIYNLTVFSRKI
jgi:hypothetical protein